MSGPSDNRRAHKQAFGSRISYLKGKLNTWEGPEYGAAVYMRKELRALEWAEGQLDAIDDRGLVGFASSKSVADLLAILYQRNGGAETRVKPSGGGWKVFVVNGDFDEQAAAGALGQQQA